MQEVDLLIVGGGITGLGLAVHAARRDLRVVLAEAGPLGGVSTQRSGALVRTHYADRGSTLLALRGLEDFERFEERYGGSAGFVPTGFAYVPDEHELRDGSFEARVATLRELGVDTELLDADALRAVDPHVDVSDAGVVAYEPRSGYADPAQVTAALAAAARAAGADLRPFSPAASLLAEPGDAPVTGAALAGGAEPVHAATTVLCAGAWSAGLAAGADVDLPLRATAVKLAFLRRTIPTHLTVIDAPNGTYLRPEGPGATLVGRRTWTDEPLEDPDAALPDVDADFVADARARLARRLPVAAGAELLATRAGMLDMTPDGLPLVGPSARPGLWLCCGWSGTGFKTGPSVGEALAGWIGGDEPPAELASLHPGRDLREPAGARSPH
jgi:sarcosine oxidase subunit beta